MSDFSETLNELMLEAGISAQQLSNAVSIGAPAIRTWKRGGGTTLSKLLILAGYFNCSLDFLAGRTDKRMGFLPKECPPFYCRFRQVLKEAGYNRYTFTKNTRFKDKYFSKWQNGADPNINTLTELATLFDCTIDYLVGRET